MRTRPPVTTLILFSLILTAQVAAAPPRSQESIEDAAPYRDLPRDPLLVLGIHAKDAAGKFRGLVDLYRRFASGPDKDRATKALAGVGRALASTFENEVLPCLGPEIVLAVDLPPLDEVASALQYPKGEALAAFLDRVGVVARPSDGERLDRALRSLISQWGGESRTEKGLTEAVVPLPRTTKADGSVSEPSALKIYYGMQDGRWALSLSASWVRAALGPRPAGQRLTDGEDFKTVFAHLDPRPVDLMYINLPKLRAYVTGSHVLQIVLQTTPEIRGFVDRYFTPETMSVGLGSTSIVLEDGVRTTHFGPSWMSGTAMSGGLVAAMALPSLLTSADEGRIRETMTDIEAISDACEGFSTDVQSYPGPTDGWVPVSKIAAYLEPIYIGQLPRTDAWHNPILYWSDGGSYRILSRGQDGVMDRDWTDNLQELAAVGLDGDIVIGDGRLLAYPHGVSED